MNTSLQVMHDSSALQFALSYASELAKADLLPKPYQKKPAMVLVAMEMAKDLGCSVVAVMNGTYEIGGRLSFYTDFMLAQARRSGVIKAVSYETVGEGPKLVVAARAVLSQGEVVEASVSMSEAVSEGWTRNAKYRSMPEQMLRKRAMKRLISNFCPEVMLGTSDDDEEDAGQGSARQEPPRAVSALTAKLSARQVLESYVASDSGDKDACIVEVEAPKEQKPQDPQTAETTEEQDETFSINERAHRDLVTQAFNSMEIPARWRNLHKEQLAKFLQAKAGLRATAEEIQAAVEEYVVDNPPAGVK